MWRRCQAIVDEPAQGVVGRNGIGISRHQVAHAQPAECLPRREVTLLGTGGPEQEPADERQPGAAEGRPGR